MSNYPVTIWSYVILRNEIKDVNALPTSVYVGDDSIPTNNSNCGDTPTDSGTSYSCEGRNGMYIGIAKNNNFCLVIAGLKAYSYVLNGYQDYTYSIESDRSPDSSPLIARIWQVTRNICDTYGCGSTQAFYEIKFPTPRFIQIIIV